VIPSAVAQRILVKFLPNENVKPAEVLKRRRAQFDDKTPSRTQVYDWNESFKGGRSEVENMRRLHLLQGKIWPELWELQGVLFVDFLIEPREVNTTHY
jgi:hypothetical protein